MEKNKVENWINIEFEVFLNEFRISLMRLPIDERLVIMLAIEKSLIEYLNRKNEEKH